MKTIEELREHCEKNLNNRIESIRVEHVLVLEIIRENEKLKERVYDTEDALTGAITEITKQHRFILGLRNTCNREPKTDTWYRLNKFIEDQVKKVKS